VRDRHVEVDIHRYIFDFLCSLRVEVHGTNKFVYQTGSGLGDMVQVAGEPRAEPEEMSRGHHDEESEEARIERLGRQRPACFDTWLSEYTFCFSVVMSQILAVRAIFPRSAQSTHTD
jgi:hypothetical protein